MYNYVKLKLFQFISSQKNAIFIFSHKNKKYTGKKMQFTTKSNN